MNTGVWLPNLKDWLSGTLTSGKNALDVNVANATLPVALTPYAFKEFRFQDAAVTSIPASGGTAVEVGDTNIPASAVAVTCSELKIANNTGYALSIYKGANSGALTQIGIAHAGQTSEAAFGAALVATDKIWVRAVQNAAITTGELLVTLNG